MDNQSVEAGKCNSHGTFAREPVFFSSLMTIEAETSLLAPYPFFPIPGWKIPPSRFFHLVAFGAFSDSCSFSLRPSVAFLFVWLPPAFTDRRYGRNA